MWWYAQPQMSRLLTTVVVDFLTHITGLTYSDSATVSLIGEGGWWAGGGERATDDYCYYLLS